MHIKLLLSMSLRNLRRHGRQSRGTFVIIAVSVLALSLLAGYTQSNITLIQNAFMRWGARGHLVIERPSSQLAREVEGSGQNPIASGMQAKIDQILSADPAVAVRARILRISGMVSNANVSTIFAGIGQDVEAVRQIKGPAYEYDVVAGTPLWQETRSHALVLGQGLAAILGCQVPDVGFAPVQPGQTPVSRPINCPPNPLELTATTTGTSRVNATLVQPTGIMDWGIKEINDRLVVMPLPDAQALLDTQEISEYHVLLTDDASLEAARARLIEKFKAAGVDATVFRWSDRATFYQQVKAVLGGFLGFIAVVAGVVSFTSLLNASYMNFTQRAREFATLRSLGFSRPFVMTLTALENSWLAFAAALIGAVCAVSITWAVRAARIMWIPPGSSNAITVDVAWVVPVYSMALAVAVILAALASFMPTRSIVRRPLRSTLAEA